MTSPSDDHSSAIPSTSRDLSANFKGAPTPLLKRRGRKPKAVSAAPSVVTFDTLITQGLNRWQHHHHERENPIDWAFASITPALGQLVLKTVYSMSGVGNTIDSGSTALSYQTWSAPFFRWMKDQQKKSGSEVGVDSTVFPPDMWAAYKESLDARVAANEIKSKTAYQYKGTMGRIFRRIWDTDPLALGPGWHERSFMGEDFENDNKQREPYSAAEARRILDFSTKLLVEAAADGRAEDPTNLLVDIAAYTCLSLRLGIESECLDAIKVGGVKPSADGTVMHLTYKKRRVRNRQARSRTTDPIDPAPEGEKLAEQIGSFGTAGGLLALMLRRAQLLGKLPEDRLWRVRIDARDFAWYTGILAGRGLRCDYGSELKIDRTKFRVTYKTAKNVESRGMLPLVADDNTPAVRARHYDGSERMKPVYEQAIEDAALEALAYAQQGPKVIDLPNDADDEAISAASDKLEVSVEQIKAALTGKTDVWLSSCRDFYNSPFDPSGKPCSKAFFKCLGCGNALVTRRNLPRVIRFLGHIEEKRGEMSDLDWQLKFSKTHEAILTEILPTFPAAIVAFLCFSPTIGEESPPSCGALTTVKS
ncbi:hypothetical protein [Sphingomonas sp.]|jgi:hypothetical protein|uniref:hypothetical protein n=1 Tax=Sphingomonas sp. TaxID=28214 RepID=UPI00260475EB|nr:hypothetical protein [Sphingomonas sp.]MDF2496342.1 hypothetical protein [Sphingomonas sp.]